MSAFQVAVEDLARRPRPVKVNADVCAYMFLPAYRDFV
jgi:hypothetical protein